MTYSASRLKITSVFVHRVDDSDQWYASAPSEETFWAADRLNLPINFSARLLAQAARRRVLKWPTVTREAGCWFDAGEEMATAHFTVNDQLQSCYRLGRSDRDGYPLRHIKVVLEISLIVEQRRLFRTDQFWRYQLWERPLSIDDAHQRQLLRNALAGCADDSVGQESEQAITRALWELDGTRALPVALDFAQSAKVLQQEADWQDRRDREAIRAGGLATQPVSQANVPYIRDLTSGA
ncbi:MAG TPA: hypothetical protein VLI05_00625 [Candidatus Saccharimonadia bacterium]|nr:hypothetical protein [Candidatus Saccharimonadia bacterium]